MGIFDSIFGGGDNPADAAMPYLEKARAGYEPYQQRGQEAGDLLGGIFSKYASDPAGALEELMGRYQPSSRYKLLQDRMGTAASNTAAAGGYRGSPREQFSQQQLTEGLLSDDMQRYLNNILGIQDRGIKGESDFYDKGFQSTSDIGNIFGTEGSLAFQGQREENKRGQDLLKALLQLGGTAAGAYFGGVPGAQVGSALGTGAGAVV